MTGVPAEIDIHLETEAELLELRDMIVNDPVALGKWRTVIDYIVPSAADVRRLRILVNNGEFEAAILEALQVWEAQGRQRVALADVFRKLGLNSLADKALKEFGRPRTQTPQIKLSFAPSSKPDQGPQMGHTPPPPVPVKNKSSTILLWTSASFCVLAVISVSFLSLGNQSQPSEVTAPAPQVIKSGSEYATPAIIKQQEEVVSANGNGQITLSDLKRIRDLVTSDSIALQKWGSVVDYIVASPSDDLRIKKLIRSGDFEDGVLQSLRIWYAAGAKRADLVRVLRDQGLNVLADAVSEIL